MSGAVTQRATIVLLVSAVAVGASLAFLARARQARARKNSALTAATAANGGSISGGSSQVRPVLVPIRKDVNEVTSFANFQDCVVSNIKLALSVDFERRVMGGTCVLLATVRTAGTSELVLDSNKLTITSIQVRARGSNQPPRDVEYSFGAQHAAFGTAVRIPLPEDLRITGSEIEAHVSYETAAAGDCSAMQWLPPEQTAGKVHPYLFTQCQAIHCRSMIPCQDAPCVKVTYEAELTVPAPLVALMSAVSQGSYSESDSSTTFAFKQEVPISAYLIAITVGELEARDVSPRVRVWAEPSVADLAVYEFGESEMFIQSAEALCGPYMWGRYDMVVQPPSFPYGGMENPNLTTLTPTLLAGDRSLANVLCHEAVHSWSGNLVTNATWNDFWLNEGLTVFIERRIISKLFGPRVAAMKQRAGWAALKMSVGRLGADHAFTRLNIPMDGIDPDDSFSSVAYEKGCALFCFLEQTVGGPAVFEPFLKAYFCRFQFGTVSSPEFKSFFLQYFEDKKSVSKAALNSIDWETWIYKPGMPPVKPTADITLINIVETVAHEWLTSGELSACASMDANWNYDQKKILLETLIQAVDDGRGERIKNPDVLDRVDMRYGFTATHNCELTYSWCLLCLKVEDERKLDLVVRFLSEQGRMKLVRPLYQQLHKGGERPKQVARSAFETYQHQYHAIAQKMIARDLELDCQT